jgi:hypothetical protein
LDQGFVSFSRICPEGGAFQNHLVEAANNGWCSHELAQESIANIDSVNGDFRIDHRESEFIPNQSFSLGLEHVQISFCFVVKETCFWDRKCHLTEKIFKPILSQMPFVLVGPAYNLSYLKSYGFRTFNDWWDESYDEIVDPVARLAAIGTLIKHICSYSVSDLTQMLIKMTPVLEHNFNLFNSREFLKSAWQELSLNLQKAVADIEPIKYPIPPVMYSQENWPKIQNFDQ